MGLLTVAVEIVFLLLLVVLPLIPAILIYRLFPNTSVVASGPLSGLTLKSSGAFSVYIVVFLAISPFAYQTYGSIPTLLAQSWTIRGTIAVQDANGHDITDRRQLSELLRAVKIILIPDPTGLNGTNDFEIKVPQVGSSPPNLLFVIGNNQGSSNPIDFRFPKTLDIKSDNWQNVQNIGKPVVIVLTSSEDYHAPTAPLAALPESQTLTVLHR